LVLIIGAYISAELKKAPHHDSDELPRNRVFANIMLRKSGKKSKQVEANTDENGKVT
jgi:hypothetical protein